ncbi:1-phosphofructokinase family hexose kinase [Salinibacterium sp. PAMC 21357]|uniref:1-phosphofructokinase family hexose kinase n=1 Tax=Salinibacterium sp. PAMC 21357 TaxID=1112215 RepID=UPI000288AD4D|nr:PfkB family carbohydrate kinase [Salinibacterium sp. PAMC 21357]
MITVVLLSPALDVTYLVDEVRVGAIHRPSTVLRSAGGKGLNVARAARRLRTDAHVVMPVGGQTGALVAELATAEGVTVSTVAVHGLTRSCVTAIDGVGLTEFYEPAPVLTADEQERIFTTLAAVPAGGWTVLSGSIPAGIDTTHLREALAQRSARGDAIAIDTHGPMLGILADELRPALVKVNRHEVAELLGRDDSAGVLAAGLRARTGGTVIVTDGAAGSFGIDETGIWRAQLDAAPGLFPVGSGDSYLAGVLVALTQGQSLATALAVASGAASANAAVPGAATFDAELARQLAARTVVTAL